MSVSLRFLVDIVVPESEATSSLLDLENTAERVGVAYKQMTSGYWEDSAEVLKMFTPDHTDVLLASRNSVVQGPIQFSSLCAHHLMPFTGSVWVGYEAQGDPESPIGYPGLSKLSRLVGLYSRRLQVQERLGAQIGKALYETGRFPGVVVAIAAQHDCMRCRGVRSNATTLTVARFGRPSMDIDGAVRSAERELYPR